jgi:hypothetical protein
MDRDKDDAVVILQEVTVSVLPESLAPWIPRSEGQAGQVDIDIDDKLE